MPANRWEYHQELVGWEGDQKLLNRLGGEGWELAGILPTDRGEYSLFVFKRPLGEPTK